MRRGRGLILGGYAAGLIAVINLGGAVGGIITGSPDTTLFAVGAAAFTALALAFLLVERTDRLHRRIRALEDPCQRGAAPDISGHTSSGSS